MSAIPEGWSVLEIKGRGIVVGHKGALLFVEGVKLGEDGEYTADEQAILERRIIESIDRTPFRPPAPQKNLSSLSEVSVKAFKDEMGRKNLNSGGEYGANGVYLSRLLEFLKGVTPGSELENLMGTFLSTGDHQRYGAAGAVLSLKPESKDELIRVLSTPEQDIVENFVDRVATGAA